MRMSALGFWPGGHWVEIRYILWEACCGRTEGGDGRCCRGVGLWLDVRALLLSCRDSRSGQSYPWRSLFQGGSCSGSCRLCGGERHEEVNERIRVNGSFDFIPMSLLAIYVSVKVAREKKREMKVYV